MSNKNTFAKVVAITSLRGMFANCVMLTKVPSIPILLMMASAATAQTTATHVDDYKAATIKNKPAKVSSRNSGWRWTHDGTNLTTAPAKCEGETWTPWHIVESPTFEDACKEIERRGLKVPERLKAEIDGTREILAEEAKRAEIKK